MKLFLSPKTSNSSIGTPEEFDGQTFWLKALFFKQIKCGVCCSASSKLVIILSFLTNFSSKGFFFLMPFFGFSTLVFSLRILPVFDPPTCFLTFFCKIELIACFGDFFFVTTSTSSGAAWTINPSPIFLATRQSVMRFFQYLLLKPQNRFLVGDSVLKTRLTPIADDSRLPISRIILNSKSK